MQHVNVLKKLNFDLLTPSPGSGVGGGGSASKIFATMSTSNHVSTRGLQATMQHVHVLKKLNFDLQTPSPGVCEQNICYHATAFLILSNMICNVTMFWIFWPNDPNARVVGGGGRWCLPATMLLHLGFPLIWYATWPHYLTIGSIFKHWPIWFERCRCMQHTCLLNASPNHVIHPIGWFKLFINLRHHVPLEPNFWPKNVLV